MQIDHQRLRAVCRAIVAATGSTGEEPDIVANHLVEANLKGHDSHGLGMLPRYVGLFNRGLLTPNQTVEIVADAPPILHVDGRHGYGQAVARQAMLLAVDRARAGGACILSLRNCNHIGRVGTYGEMAVDAGLASLHFVNATGHVPRVAPYGGSDARLPTNPMVIAIPTADDKRPFVLDMATAAIAMGKVRVAKNKGETVEGDLLLDPQGRPTTDPNVMFRRPIGALRAFGLHKGYGISLACELLAGAFSGGGTIQPERQAPDTIVNNMFALVFDPARLADPGWSKPEIDKVVAYVTGSPPADPSAPVLIAGDPERAMHAERTAKGVPVDPTTWEEILAAGETLGLARGDIERMAA